VTSAFRLDVSITIEREIVDAVPVRLAHLAATERTVPVMTPATVFAVVKSTCRQINENSSWPIVCTPGCR